MIIRYVGLEIIPSLRYQSMIFCISHYRFSHRGFFKEDKKFCNVGILNM